MVRAAGIGWQLARTWPGGRDRERRLKRQGGASRRCPMCGVRPQPPRRAAAAGCGHQHRPCGICDGAFPPGVRVLDDAALAALPEPPF